ncbi:WXG100 family type VII secretion target [Streptomyces sp. NPDC015661]|uniref:WXG100 family type VII secretion target n=1 Tax=Streptomyces sp. NPDC015661 TaxID=3364961 RepID=UPI0037017DCD
MRPAEGGGGGGTNFAGMTHEQMLVWLDEASSYYVGEAARRLKTASDQLATIASDLRASMRDMDWEGEAEKAFVEWATNVANSTTHLSDYAERGSVCMEDNSSAIASAQSAMPRYTSQADAKENLDAALKYHNDPDSQTIARNARASMATSDDAAAIKAKEEANRQAAADEMYRLSSAYEWSSFRMNSEVPPTFPPPPGSFVPKAPDGRDSSSYLGSTQETGNRSTGTETTTGTRTTHTTQPDTRTTPDTPTVPPTGDPTGPTHVIRPEVRPDAPVDLGIDSVETLPKPDTTGPTTHTPGGPPPLTRPDGGTPPFVTTTGMPPLTTKGGPGPLGPTSPITGGTGNPRNPATGGLRNTPGMPREGISGGRQVPSTTGRPQTGIPRSTVIGNEPTGQNRTGMGRGMGGAHGMGGSMGGGAGQSGISGGRRLAGESGGVVGGKAQRAGAAGGGKPFTAGGSGLVRGNAAKPGEREEQNGERPDYLVEDEETWQQGRRVAPPVID